MKYYDFYHSHFDRLKGGGSQVMAFCPFHANAKTPSLSINLDDGLWNCKGCHEKGNANQMAERMSWDKPDKEERTSMEDNIAKIYSYHDEHGKELYQIIRVFPLNPKKFLYRHQVGSEWVYSIKGVERVPYNLQQLVKTSECVLVEGEKDADTICRLGYVGTCIPCGSGGWKKEYAKYFEGKKVYIIPDCDKPGEEFLKAVQKDLSVRVIRLEGKDGFDITDWSLGKTKADFEALLRGKDKDNKSVLNVDLDAWDDIKSIEAQGKDIKPTGVTSIKDLDFYTWGFQPQTVYVIGARTSIGKSSFAVTITTEAALNGYKILYFAIESSAKKIRLRMLSQLSGLPLRKLTRGPLTKEDTDKISEAMQKPLNIHINDKNILSSTDIREYTELRKEIGGVDLVIVDHIQEIKESNEYKSRHLELSDATQRLREMAEDLNLPVILISQLRRPASKGDGDVPTIYELKESGDIEQKADMVILLHRTRGGDEVSVTVAKARDEATGSFDMDWDAERLTFKERSPYNVFNLNK
jgi:KaiC/GvpD/RAD55 family RecA-like ATPase/Zn-finger protein